MKKKYQIFISSTYLDLQEERQAAVEAILNSKNIPAGMELFKAGNNSQLDTIKKWIDESDIYMLILGGRYGSIEENSGQSYTQIEYEYALSKGKPVFSLVLSDKFLRDKQYNFGEEYEVYEKENIEKYDEFKKTVSKKLVTFAEDLKDIKIFTRDSIDELIEENELIGWVKGNSVDSDKHIRQVDSLLAEIEAIRQENNKLKNESANQVVKEYKIDDSIKEFLSSEIIIDYKVEEDYGLEKYTYNMKISDLLKHVGIKLITAVTNGQLEDEIESIIKELDSVELDEMEISNISYNEIKRNLYQTDIIDIFSINNREAIKLSEKGISIIKQIR